MLTHSKRLNACVQSLDLLLECSKAHWLKVGKKVPNIAAIMQPYIFPNVGYINLVAASDTFVFYDDVNFIQKGWINRNRVILNGEPYRFTIPLKSQSQNMSIKDIKTFDIKAFSNKFLSQLESSYKNSLFKNDVLSYVNDVLDCGEISIGNLAAISVEKFFQYLQVEKKFLKSSEEFPYTNELGRVERLAAITKGLGSSRYVNTMGGTSLYSKEVFKAKGVELYFVKPSLLTYHQCNCSTSQFIAGLSIIDIMMNQSVDEICIHLKSYELA